MVRALWCSTNRDIVNLHLLWTVLRIANDQRPSSILKTRTKKLAQASAKSTSEVMPRVPLMKL